MTRRPFGGDAVPERRCEGVVTTQLPSGLYGVEVGGTRVTAHVGSGTGRNFVRLLVGDRVVVELAPRDPTRGRIVSRQQTAGSRR
jgi:translation initiation factor IF-1